MHSSRTARELLDVELEMTFQVVVLQFGKTQVRSDGHVRKTAFRE